ncbi:beta-lactamase-like protein [Russula compacta]|nr:beta-lactamase-like protein [Russula compacta]
MLTFTPLSGAAKSSRTSPLAYLLQVDDINILLDCGSPDWCPESPPSVTEGDHVQEDKFHWERYCNKLREIAPSVDLVLLSHGDLAHTGLYPYAYSRWGLNAPAYSTLPVQAMARIAATEETDGIRDEEDVGGAGEQVAPGGGDDAPSPDPSNSPQDGQPEEEPQPQLHSPKGKYVATPQEVHDSFDAINTLRYSQPAHLSGRCQGLTITPFNAGHTLGGTIWKIRSPVVGTIVYAVNMNHMRERHLDGTVLINGAGGSVFESLARPDLLITDADRANAIGSRRKDRDAALIDTITTTLSSRSSLLLPCDASTRVLELLVLLDQHWSFARLKFPICLLSRTGREMLTFVRSMMEWLGGTVSKEDVGEETSGKRNNKRRRDDDADEEAIGAFALRFKHLEFFPNPQVLLETYSSKDPKLILAVPASFSHGPSRLLFADFAAVPDNVILLTGRGEEGTLGRILFERWNKSQRAEEKWDKGKLGNNVMLDGSLELRLNSKVPLTGVELEIFQQKQRLAREKAALAQAALARSQQLLEADEGADSSDSDSDAADEEDVERALGLETESARADGADWGRGMDADESGRQMLSFDIYLKGNVSRAVSFFKSAGKENQRFRMFPYVEKKRRVDEYGEVIDVAMWEEADDEEVKERKRQEEEAKRVPEEVPSKYVSTVVEVQLACRLLFIDLEGLNDGRATKTIIPKVAPRKLIIVHGGPAATEAFLESCASIRTMTKDIYAPAEGESVQIGQNTNSYSVSLSDEMLASVRMSRFEDNEVGFVTGRITTSASANVPELEPTNQVSVSASRPVSTLPRVLGARPTQRLPHSTMIGELKLTALKARLATVGVQAEFIGEGVLVCRGGDVETVAVRKSGRGQVELEGTVCDVYYKVRKEIYGLHALVSS